MYAGHQWAPTLLLYTTKELPFGAEWSSHELVDLIILVCSLLTFHRVKGTVNIKSCLMAEQILTISLQFVLFSGTL